MGRPASARPTCSARSPTTSIATAPSSSSTTRRPSRFTNEFVSSLQGTGIDAFKERYRRADVLLIDDVQFLQGKARTADEFFHTFNALYEHGAQLVLTADRVPAELSSLAERLRDRFEWGLTVSVSAPRPRHPTSLPGPTSHASRPSSFPRMPSARSPRRRPPISEC